ncbi:MAG: 6-phosphogluconolactonase [Planctomycetota bacterium]
MPAPAEPIVQIVPTAEAATPLLLGELRAAIARRTRPVIGFATGATFAPLFAALAAEFAAGRIGRTDFVATHLDEYEGFPPARAGGMVHELVTRCPPFADMLAAGAFAPVPADDRLLPAHEERIARLGGVELQFLGIGRNGHVAFNEPGTPFETGFHRTALATTTREDARPRFLPDEPPRHALTAGIASILAARRLVLCAFGKGKAAAVAAMLGARPATSCPASAVRLHGNALVVLDRAASASIGQAAE